VYNARAAEGLEKVFGSNFFRFDLQKQTLRSCTHALKQVQHSNLSKKYLFTV